jgi:replicative DNA helicase
MRQLYSEEAEQAVIGACFLDNTVAEKVTERVWVDDFHVPINKEIFTAIQNLIASNVVSDAVTVSDKAGHFDYCIDLARNTPSTANVNAYISIIKDYAKERELYAVGQLISDELLFNEEAKTTERVQRIEAAFTALSTERIPSTVFTIKDAVKDLLAHLEWQNDNSDHKGIVSGIDYYDERTGGYNGGEMIVIAGTPGAGKTTFGMQIARQSCTDGKRVMVFSLEMPKRQLAQRMMAASHAIPLNAFKDGSAYQSQEHAVKLAPAASTVAKMDMVIDDQGGIDILDLKSRARIAHREKKLDLILIDYLQLLNDRRHKDRFQVVSSVSREIKALSKELNIPVIALSQL